MSHRRLPPPKPISRASAATDVGSVPRAASVPVLFGSGHCRSSEPGFGRSGATPPTKVRSYLCNFGPKDLLTPPKSKVGDLSRSAPPLLWAQRTKVEDPSRFAPHVLWAQLLQPSYPILFADMNLPLERAASGLQSSDLGLCGQRPATPDDTRTSRTCSRGSPPADGWSLWLRRQNHYYSDRNVPRANAIAIP
jgi:hypothetical protein